MKRHVLIFGLVGGLLIATLQYTEYRFVIIEHSVELYSALVAILFATFGIWLGLRITRRRETIVVREVLAYPAPRTLRSQYGPPAEPRHHGTRARNPHPDRPRPQQSRDRHAAFRLREHRQDPLLPRLRQARSRAPHPGRAARQRTRPAALIASPKSTISAPFLQNHPKG